MSQLSLVIKKLQTLLEQQGDIQIEFNYAVNLSQDSSISLPLTAPGVHQVPTSYIEYNSRKSICMGCPEKTTKIFSEDHQIDFCNQCGCPLNSILRIKTKRCPLEKFS